MKRKLLSLLLAITMVLPLLQGSITPVSAGSSPAGVTLRTAKLDFTDSTYQSGATNSGDVWTNTAEGWSYNTATNTLTLSGVNIRSEDSASEDTYGILLPDGATIVLAAGTTNYVKSGDAGTVNKVSLAIHSRGALTIEGPGRLISASGNTIEGQNSSISGSSVQISGGDVTVTTGTVTGTGVEKVGIYSCGIYADTDVTIGGGTVYACSGMYSLGKGSSYGIYAKAGEIKINGGIVIAKASLYRINYCGAMNKESTGSIKKPFYNTTMPRPVKALEIALFAPATYKTLGEGGPDGSETLDFERDPKPGLGDLEAKGWAWNEATKTLTMKNLIVWTYSVRAIVLPAGAKIVLEGKNVVCSGSAAYWEAFSQSYAISGAGSFTIEGPGSLLAASGTPVERIVNGQSEITESTGIRTPNLHDDPRDRNYLTIKSCDVTAIGGFADGSMGIQSVGIDVVNGNLTAIGGRANDINARLANTAGISGGRVIASGGSTVTGISENTKKGYSFSLDRNDSSDFDVIAPRGFKVGSLTFTGWIVFRPITPENPTILKTECVTIGKAAAANPYSVTFDANNGSGSMPVQAFVSGTSQSLALNKFIRPDFAFKGWATSPGGAVAYADGASYTATGNAILYAVWADSSIPLTCSITWDDQGATIPHSGGSITVNQGSAMAVPTTAPIKTGSSFGGWYTVSDGGGTEVTNGSIAPASAAVTYYAKWTVTQTHAVSGTVTDNNFPVPNAAVKLMYGRTEIGQEVFTDAEGLFRIPDITSGTYNLVVTQGDKVVTKIITISGEDYAAGTIILPSGKTNSVVEVKSNTPPVVVGKLDELFGPLATEKDKGITAEDNAVVLAGGTVEIRLTAQGQTADTAANAGSITAEAAGNGKTVGLFIDLAVFKTVKDFGGIEASGQSSVLTELPDLIEVLIPLDAAHQGRANYVLYRYHGSAVDTITAVENPEHEKIELINGGTVLKATLKKFSTYAVAYTASTYTVSFDSNGGTAVAPITGIAGGSTVTAPISPTKENRSFVNWYTDSSLNTPWNFGTDTVSGNITLYAKWKSTESDGGKNGGGGGSSSHTYYTITVKPVEGGSISPLTSSVEQYTSKTFTMVPNQGYKVSDVRVNGVSVGAVSEYTFTRVDKAQTLEVKFAKAEPDRVAKIQKVTVTSAENPGIPYYLNAGEKMVFIGYSANLDGKMTYIAPPEVTVLFKENPKTFTDLSGHWAKGNIDTVTSRELFVGTAPAVFSPDQSMTRAMFATVIGRLHEASYGKIPNSTKAPFTDMAYDSYYAPYVIWAAENGIVSGMGGGRFEPDRSITRQEMAVLISNYMKFKGIVLSDRNSPVAFTDASHIESWAKSQVEQVQKLGVMSGIGENQFSPQGISTRAQVAAVLERMIALVLK